MFSASGQGGGGRSWLQSRRHGGGRRSGNGGLFQGVLGFAIAVGVVNNPSICKNFLASAIKSPPGHEEAVIVFPGHLLLQGGPPTPKLKLRPRPGCSSVGPPSMNRRRSCAGLPRAPRRRSPSVQKHCIPASLRPGSPGDCPSVSSPSSRPSSASRSPANPPSLSSSIRNSGRIPPSRAPAASRSRGPGSPNEPATFPACASSSNSTRS